MNIPDNVPRDKRLFLEPLVTALSRIPNVAAIVLGGSYAGRTERESSDLDIGVYYLESAPFSVADIRRLAAGASRADFPPVVTDFYEWGPWVNGGAWIETQAGRIDFLYRNLNQVQRTIREAREGIVRHDYGQQPTTGFYSVAYLAETEICVPLHDPGSRIAELKRQVDGYPAKLKQKIVGDSLWSAEFTLVHARSYAASADVYNTVGCATRIAACLTQALFALNERYFLGDKRVMETIALFPILPPGYPDAIRRILVRPGDGRAALSGTVACLESVWKSVVALAGDAYRPKYAIGAAAKE